LWPFPIDALRPVAERARRIVVVEASAGQLEDELRLAMSHGEIGQGVVIDHVRRMGGVLPGQREIVERVVSLEGAAS
jgi:2-oxoglutarate ferredoxin oxidoreductase subunit alpha/2-oxoisovalerate ferredoxin oxidoreductase alpha subunit